MLLGATGAQASPTWQSYVTDIAPTATTHTVTGLRPAHAYQFQVSAVNAVGRGEASAPSPVIRLPEQRKCRISVTVATFVFVILIYDDDEYYYYYYYVSKDLSDISLHLSGILLNQWIKCCTAHIDSLCR